VVPSIINQNSKMCCFISEVELLCVMSIKSFLANLDNSTLDLFLHKKVSQLARCFKHLYTFLPNELHLSKITLCETLPVVALFTYTWYYEHLSFANQRTLLSNKRVIQRTEKCTLCTEFGTNWRMFHHDLICACLLLVHEPDNWL
jgi:hypothetical protein